MNTYVSKSKFLSGAIAVMVSLLMLVAPSAPQASANPAGMAQMSSNFFAGNGGNNNGILGLLPRPSLPAPSAPAPQTNVEDVKAQITDQTNNYRLNNSPKKYVAKLKATDQINNGAQNWANKMAQTNNFNHDPNLGASGAKSENIFMSNAPVLAAQDVVNAWAKSPGHERNLLDGVNETGVGIAKSDDGNWYVVARYNFNYNGHGEMLRG